MGQRLRQEKVLKSSRLGWTRLKVDKVGKLTSEKKHDRIAEGLDLGEKVEAMILA